MPHLPTTEIDLVGVALDGRVELRALEDEPELEIRDRARPRFVYAYRGLAIHVFALGAVVVVGAEQIDDELRGLVERCTGRRVLAGTLDAYHLSVDEGASRPVADWDRIVVPRFDDETIAVCTLLLARSAGIERYERAADPLLAQGLALAREFGGRGRPPWGTRSMIRRMGGLAVQRLELARWFVHLDRPEVAWEDPTAERLYDVLNDHFELAERHQALLQRIASLEQSLSTIVSVWDSRRSRALEWAIIGLIAVEIVLAVFRE